MAEDMELFEHKRSLIEERIGYNSMLSVFATLIFCRSIYYHDYTFLFILIPFSLYIFLIKWKSGKLWEYINPLGVMIVITQGMGIDFVDYLVKNEDTKGVFIGLGYYLLFIIPLFFGSLKEYISSIREVK